MRIFALGIIAGHLAVLQGCATPQPPTQHTYTYDSRAHTGSVLVTDKTEHGRFTCDALWREGTQYKPLGVPSSLPYHINVDIFDITTATSEGRVDHEDIAIRVPPMREGTVFARDLQENVSWMLGVDTHGVLQQGNNFFYPEGFFIRAANSGIQDNHIKLCLGIDRMYVPEADFAAGGEPTINLDRLSIPFQGKAGEVFTYTLDGIEPTTLSVRVRIQ